MSLGGARKARKSTMYPSLVLGYCDRGRGRGDMIILTNTISEASRNVNVLVSFWPTQPPGQTALHPVALDIDRPDSKFTSR